MIQIPSHVIDDIRERSDIVEIILEHVLLKKSGQNFKGLCPFHQEKTPSFMVSPVKRIYHCFGCSAGGNVFKFLMEIQGLTFVESVKKLGDRYGIAIPESEAPRPKGEISERELLFRINQTALDYFRMLLKKSPQGKIPRNYLESRSFDTDTQAQLQLGWSLPEWTGLLNHFKKKGFTQSQLEKAGLIKKKDRSNENQPASYYDRFRGRIIFPLHDGQGKVVGFAGRVIKDTDREPKYLNSPETSLYKKGEQLYGFHLAREFIRKEDQVLIVEGYFDQIRTNQVGIRNVVATCGTALTPQQVSLLKNQASSAVLVFDSDIAGQAATQRGFELFMDQGMQVSVLSLPKGEDPDSYILKFGADLFLKQLNEAKPYLEYKIQVTLEAIRPQTTAGKIKVINDILPLMARIKNQVEQMEGVRLLSEKLSIDDKAMLAELKKAVEKNKTFLREPESKDLSCLQPEEYYLIQLLIHGGKPAELIRNHLASEDFRNETLQKLAEVIFTMVDRGESIDLDRALDLTEDSEVKEFLTQAGLDPIEFDHSETAAQDCIRRMKIRNLEPKIKALKKERNEAQKAGQMERCRQLHQLIKEMETSVQFDACAV